MITSHFLPVFESYVLARVARLLWGFRRSTRQPLHRNLTTLPAKMAGGRVSEIAVGFDICFCLNLNVNSRRNYATKLRHPKVRVASYADFSS